MNYPCTYVHKQASKDDTQGWYKELDFAMSLCYTRGERKSERRGGRERLSSYSVDLLLKIAKGVALRARRGIEREGGRVSVLHKVRKTRRREGYTFHGITENRYFNV